jgi:ATP-dependent DNA helicase RecG
LALIGEHIQAGDFQSAELLLDKLGTGDAFARAVTTLASAHAGSDPTKAASLLDRLPPRLAESDACEAAILERRLGRNDRAHTLFESVGNIVLQDVRALHEFAQTKIALTRSLVRSRRPSDQQVRARLLNESLSFLTRVVQMDAPPTRHAWAWFNIGQVRQWLNMPPQGVIEAFGRAVSMAPGEEKFVAALARAKQGR